MTFLLDVNVLLAAIWDTHPLHERAFAGIKDKDLAICPLGELGFIRISTNSKASINAPMSKTRDLLQRFIKERYVTHIPDDLPALDSKPGKSDEVTDCYLADLAAKHGFKLVTMDGQIKHPGVVVI